MKIKILGCGTSTGVPLPGCRCAVCTSQDPRNKRLRTSALIVGDDGSHILIDASTDLRQQALLWDIRRIDALLLTHAHADHILGLDDLRSFNFVQKQAIQCYATAPTLNEVRQVFKYIFEPDPNYEGGLITQLSVHEITNWQPFKIGAALIQPFPLRHGRCVVTGFRCGELAYATDCNSIPPESLPLLKGIKHLVLDGLRYKGHKTHFTIPQAIAAAQSLGVEKTYLTHMTHTVDYGAVSPQLPAGIELAYDGLELEFGG